MAKSKTGAKKPTQETKGRGRGKQKASKKSGNGSAAVVGFEQKLWAAADKMRNNMDAAEYKHVVLGLIFLKYTSDAFEEKHAQLEAEKKSGADPEDRDEYLAENIFWVPKKARWSSLQANAKQPTIGKLIDDAMVAIERDNPTLKGVLPKDFARPALDKQRLGEIIDLIGTIGLGDKSISSASSPRPRARRAASSTRPSAWCACSSPCSRPSRAASSTPAAARAACSSPARSSSKPTAGASVTSASTARSRTPPPGAWPR